MHHSWNLLLCAPLHQPEFSVLPAHPVHPPDAGRTQSADQRNTEVGTDSSNIKHGEYDHRAYYYSAQPPDVLCFETLEFYTFVNSLVDGIDIACHFLFVLRNPKKCFEHR